MKLIFSYFKDFSFKKFLYLCVILFTFAYVFAVPSFGERTGWQRYIIYISMLLIVSAVFLYVFLYDKFEIPKITLFVPAFAFFSFIGTALYSRDFRSWFSLILLAISFYSFLLSFKVIKNKYLVISIISLAFFLFCLFYIFVYRNQFMHITTVLSGKYRLGKYFDNPNGVGAYAVVSFSSSFYLVLFYKRKLRFFFLLPSIISIIVGISTGSRTFYLIVLIIVAVFFYFFFQKHKLIYLIVLASIIALGVLVLNIPALSALKDRLILSIQTLFGTAAKADTSTIQRANYIQYGFYLGSKNLLIGYGVDGFGTVTGVGTYSHCNFSELVCNFGIIGFVLFYSPLIILFIKSLIDKKIDKGFIVSFFVYYFIVSFTNVLYYKKIYYLVLAFMMYMAYFDRQTKKVSTCKDIKTIVFTCDSMGHGGAERVISTLSNSFSKLGIDVSIVGVSDRTKDGSFYALEDMVPYVPLCSGFNKKVDPFKRILLLIKTLKSINPDIVISFLPHVNIYTMFACQKLKIPYVVSERNDPKRDPKKLLIRLFKYLSFVKADGCVFQSIYARNYYYSTIREKSVIIHNPVNLDFVPKECVKEKEKVVLAVGRLTEQKNYKNLFKAFKEFNAATRGGYKLRIYGEGHLRNDLDDYCESLSIRDSVEFMGLDDKWLLKEYKDSMYVLSSDYEGMPNSLIEAMALGIPSISTDCPCGGPKEIIINGTNGFLVPVNNPDVLAKKMIEILELSPEKFYDSTREMLKEYSIDVITSQWLSFIHSLSKDVYE